MVVVAPPEQSVARSATIHSSRVPERSAQRWPGLNPSARRPAPAARTRSPSCCQLSGRHWSPSGSRNAVPAGVAATRSRSSSAIVRAARGPAHREEVPGSLTPVSTPRASIVPPSPHPGAFPGVTPRTCESSDRGLRFPDARRTPGVPRSLPSGDCPGAEVRHGLCRIHGHATRTRIAGRVWRAADLPRAERGPGRRGNGHRPAGHRPDRHRPPQPLHPRPAARRAYPGLVPPATEDLRTARVSDGGGRTTKPRLERVNLLHAHPPLPLLASLEEDRGGDGADLVSRRGF